MIRPLAISSLLVVLPFFAAHGRIPLAIRGSGTVHLRPPGNTLNVTIEKRDLNIYENAEILTVIVVAPDRSELKRATLPDDGSEGKTGISKNVQTATINVSVDMAGVYQLRFSPSNGDQVFGFSTDCPTYVIEAPIFLNDASLSGDVYFLPPAGEFTISAEAVHKPGIQSLPLQDGNGDLLHTFKLEELVTPVEYTVPADVPRTAGPWHIAIECQDVRFKIKGVTFWSNRAESLFDLALTKGLLTPYITGLDLLPGESRKVRLDLYNGKDAPTSIDVAATGSESLQHRILSPALPASVAAKSTQTVEVDIGLSPGASLGSTHTIVLTARRLDASNASGSATINVRAGKPRADALLNLPIVLRPYEHESVQFGYCPEYGPNAVFFDRHNRPYIRTRRGNKDRTTGIQTLEGNQWVERSFVKALEDKYPGHLGTRRATGWHGTKTTFDADNHLYTLLTIQAVDRKYRYLYLSSRDGGKTFDLAELPLTRGVADIEHHTGHGMLVGPPPVVLYEFTKSHPARFASFHDMKILFPTKTETGIVLGEPITITDACFGTCLHSGAPAPIATRGDRTHIVWGEIDDTGVPGVPTFAATYFHAEKRLSEKVLMGYAPPVNDVHNQPGICMDSEGYLHVVTGAHGQPFLYRCSLKPNDALSGWTKAIKVCTTDNIDPKTGKEAGRQTYLSLLCDNNDTLHIAYRQWRRGVDPYHNGAQYAALSYQRKPKGKPWEKPVPIVVPPYPSYSIYYHKLTHDRTGRLFLSYSYYSINTAYRNDIPELYDYRAVVMSADGGNAWKLLTTRDFRK